MSHYANVLGGVVVSVIVAEQDFIASLPDSQQWVQTSFNTHGGVHALGGTPFRKNYAGVGFTYDSVRDAFIPPKPFPSWTLNEDTCLFDPPTPMPEEGTWAWQEGTGWVEGAVLV